MSKSKEPVKIRFRKLDNGNQSIYLDCYYNKKRTYEFLGLYLIPEKNEFDKLQNDVTMKAALKIKSEKIIAIIENKANIKIQKNKDIDLLDWLIIFKNEQIKKGIKEERIINNLKNAITKFAPNQRLSSIDTEFCKEWLHYIRKVYTKKNGEHLKPVTAKNYTNMLNIALNKAVKMNYLVKNPFTLLDSSDKIKVPESTRTYLTEDEFNLIKNVEWDNQDAKTIFIFCCYSGLRISDVFNLTWKSIIMDGDYVRIEKIIKKTNKTITLPLCSAAIKLLPSRKEQNNNDLVFPPIKEFRLCRAIKDAAIKAGINKNVTPHCARHTFATLLLSKEANIMTIKELLGHSKIETTMVYAKIIDKTKQKTVNLLDSI